MGFPAAAAVFVLLSIFKTVSCEYTCNYTVEAPINSTVLVRNSVFIPPNTTCKWFITAPVGYKVQLVFRFNEKYAYSKSCSPSANNHLEIYDSDNDSKTKLFGKYCPETPTTFLVSTGRHMFLKISAHEKYEVGFFTWLPCTAVNNKMYGCSPSSLTADPNTTKILTSPNFPNNYLSSTSCHWSITAPSGHVVQLKFTNFSTNGITEDADCRDSDFYHTLSVYDSSYSRTSKLLGMYCGDSLPANVVSSGRNLFLFFCDSSSVLSPKTGFRVEFKAVKDLPENSSICSPFNSNSTNNNIKLKASSSYQYIQSPYYPNKYPSNIQCTWIISASSRKKKVELTLTDVKIEEKRYIIWWCTTWRDFLMIGNGASPHSSLQKTLCDQYSSPITVTSSGQKMWIQFKSDSGNYFPSGTTEAGFQAKFIEVEVEDSIDVGMIVGIVLGVIVFIGLLSVGCVCFLKKRRDREGYQQAHSVLTSTQSETPVTHPSSASKLQQSL